MGKKLSCHRESMPCLCTITNIFNSGTKSNNAILLIGVD